MQTLLLRFSSVAIAEGQKLLDSQQVMLPLRWVEPNVLEALVKKPSGVFHNCRVVLNDTRTSILKEYCTCRSENISQSTCAHIVALVIAYEDNPAGVLPFSTLANNSAQSKAASGPHKSAPAHQSTKSPGSSANKNSDRNSKGGKKLVFNSSKPVEAAASRPIRDDRAGRSHKTSAA